MVLSSWQSHCESSPGSFDECRMAPSGRRPKTKPDVLGCESHNLIRLAWSWVGGRESACTGCRKLHPPLPFILHTPGLYGSQPSSASSPAGYMKVTRNSIRTTTVQPFASYYISRKTPYKGFPLFLEASFLDPPNNVALEPQLTSSSAVSDRPRDHLCPSVVSFNSVIPPAQSFIIVTWASDLPLHRIKCCSVVFGVTLRLLVIHFVVVSHHQQTSPLISVLCHQFAMVRRG